MGRCGSDLPDALLVLLLVGVIAVTGVFLFNALAEAGSFPGPFRDTAFGSLRTVAAALVLGVGAVGTVVAYLVWFSRTCR